MTIRILLVDDHSVVRQGLRLFLKYDPELEVVGEASDGAEALRQAIKAAAAGQVQLTPKAAARLMQAVSTDVRPEALTERETEVLRLLAQGYSNKQIARRLNNTEQTIKSHVSRILSKLGVQSRTQAALYATRTGLVSPGSVEQPE